MSSRAYRKLLNQKNALPVAPPSDEESDTGSIASNEEDEVATASAREQNLFDLLNAGEEEEPVDEQEDESDTPPAPVIEQPTSPTTSKSEKKKKKKNQSKGKAPAVEAAQEEDEDEFDRTLRELNEKFGETSTDSTPAKRAGADEVKTLLGVDSRMMDADAEMKRMFGSRVVNEEIRKKNYVRTPKKHLLAAPRAQWPRMERLGLSMELVESKDGSLLSIDYYALRAKEFRWLRQLNTEWASQKGFKLLPNMAYSVAFAEWEIEIADQKDHSESSRMLQTAIAYFPSAIPGLYEKCSTTDSAVSGNSFFTAGSTDSEQSLKLLVDLFVERNHELWKVLAWLRENVRFVAERLKKADAEIAAGREVRKTKYSGHIPRNVSRHIFISDFPSISANLPPDILSQGIQMHDPIPPENAPATIYDEYQWSLARSANPFQDMGFMASFLRSLLPWMNAGGAAGAGAPGGGAGVAPPPADRQVEQEAAQMEQNQNAQEDHIAATINAAQAALPGLFPPATEDNPNPQWMATLRDTIARLGLFRPEELAGDEGEQMGDDDGEREGNDSDDGGPVGRHI
ncbi:Transcription factor 25 [Rhizophlyctis rosea]|nr:Transcription factor 25 [Rhizophlyctis rosea]